MIKVISEINQNDFSNGEIAYTNDEQYYQPLISFDFDGERGIYSDTSEPGFLLRYELQFGDKLFWYTDQNYKEDIYSNFSKEVEKDRVFVSAWNDSRIGKTIFYKEDIEQKEEV